MNENQKTFGPDDLIGLKRVSSVTPSPTGTWLAVSAQRLDSKNAKYLSELWKVPLDQEGPAIQLTRGESKDASPCFRADGALGFTSNRNPRDGDPEDGDTERAQVWVMPTAGGEPFPLTDEPLGVSSYRFAREGDRLLVLANVLPGVSHDEQREVAGKRKKHGPSAIQYDQMPVRFWDHWLPEAAPHFIAYDNRGENRLDLTPDADREYRNASWDLSPDGKWLAVTRARLCPLDRIQDRVLELISTEDGTRRVLADEQRASFSEPYFSPDGKTIVADYHKRRDGELGAPAIVLIDVESGESTILNDTWDYIAQIQGWSEDGTAIILTADMDCQVPVFACDAASGEITRLSNAEAGGSHSGVSTLPGRQAVVGIRHRWCHPPEPFRMPISADATPDIVARISGFDEDLAHQLASHELFEVNGAHGDSVQTILLTPQSDGPHPLLFWIHGGPIGQHADQWHWRWNALVPLSRGYAVALPNPRGSTGRGQAFIEGIWGNSWGAECYDDLMAVADELEARPAVDENQTVAMGGSFGGYMTNWIGTQTDRFQCLVTHASIYHFSMFYGVTDYPAWWAFEKGFYPHEDLDAFEKFSPHRYIADWRTPTLIIHGEKDYRVPIGEALALFEDLQAREVPSELLVFPDENHWILKPRNVVEWYNRFLDFADKALGR